MSAEKPKTNRELLLLVYHNSNKTADLLGNHLQHHWRMTCILVIGGIGVASAYGLLIFNLIAAIKKSL